MFSQFDRKLSDVYIFVLKSVPGVSTTERESIKMSLTRIRTGTEKRTET